MLQHSKINPGIHKTTYLTHNAVKKLALKWDEGIWTHSITSVSHVLKVYGYENDKQKEMRKGPCFKEGQLFTISDFLDSHL